MLAMEMSRYLSFSQVNIAYHSPARIQTPPFGWKPTQHMQDVKQEVTPTHEDDRSPFLRSAEFPMERNERVSCFVYARALHATKEWVP